MSTQHTPGPDGKIKRLKAEIERLGNMCDERGRNEARMFIRAREMAEQVFQLQEQNTALDSKLASHEAVMRKALAEMQRAEAIMLRECGIGVLDRLAITALEEALK